jgi:hypothetical protein
MRAGPRLDPDQCAGHQLDRGGLVGGRDQTGGRVRLAVADGGGIYTWKSDPAPLLSATLGRTNLVFSWTVPSMDVILPKNADLATGNWTDVPTAETLNLTNLQYQVALPSLAGNHFYPLEH